MLFAGTSRGVFRIDDGDSRPVLQAGGVRDLVAVESGLFAATGAGLHRSVDGGETWTLVGMADREVWQVRASTAGTLYAGTQPAGLFRSDDGGDSWHELTSFAALPEAQEWCIPLDPPLPGRARAIVVQSPPEADGGNPSPDPATDRLWVGVEVGGVARSDDGGETWKVVKPGDNPDIHMLFAHPDTANPETTATIFASTGYGRFDHIAEEIEGNAGVFRSDDDGETWSYAWHGITPRYSRPMCIDGRAPYGLTVASAPTAFSSYKDDGGADAMLFRSDDGGRSWRSLCDEAHTPSAANFHGLTVDPGRPGGVYIGTDTGEVWRVGADASWEPVADGLPAVLSLVAR